MPQPTLSVLMTNYNHSRFLQEALHAILDQSFKPIEIIVIDDNSTDESVAIIEGFAKNNNHLIRLIRNDRNMGVVYNLNRLLEIASGGYVYFAAADDKVLPGLFEKSMRLLSQYPQAGFCSGLLQLIDEKGRDLGLYKSPIISTKERYLSSQESAFVLSQNGPWAAGNTTIYSRQALIEAGGFLKELGANSDWFVMQLLALRHGACFIPEPLAAWRRMQTSYSGLSFGDYKQYLEIFKYSQNLMHATYRHLFPYEFVDKWDRKELYKIGVSAWHQVSQRQERFLSETIEELQPQHNWRAGVLAKIIRLWMQIQSLLVKIYLYSLFKPPYREWRLPCQWEHLKRKLSRKFLL